MNVDLIVLGLFLAATYTIGFLSGYSCRRRGR